jgi:hypothetical protein
MATRLGLHRLEVICFAVLALAASLYAAPGSAAGSARPRITKAVMRDADRDDRADRIVLTYSEKINHALDKDGRYPFSVSNYRVTKVAKARRSRTLTIFLKEKKSRDIAAHPALSYKPTRNRPVKDLAGNQASKQIFSKTVALDVDGDGYAAKDCAPTNAARHPGATDLPDATFLDQNCDGIDGDKAKAVFVSPTGSDSDACGAQSAACLTIQKGIDRAGALDRRDVYVRGGTYADGTFFVADGINVFGGFGSNWQRKPSLATGDIETIVLGMDDVEVFVGQFQAATVVASGLLQPTTIADLTLVGPDVEGIDASGRGKSTYTVIAEDIAAGILTLARNNIVAGDASDGADGTAGEDASLVTATASMEGGDGGNGAEFDTACNNSSKGAGGSAGTNGVPDGSSANAGAGGAGGTMDTDCSCCSFNFDARAGQAGSDAAAKTVPHFGIGGTLGPAGLLTCVTGGGDGKPGLITNGSAAPAISGGALVSGLWFTARDGTAGGAGDNGGGGGGGGGAGGCDDGTDSYGAGGGGGGAGGMRARSGGGGGRGGGSSFGIYLINSSPSIVDTTIELGVGGDGGAGGTGGRGQSGGPGGQSGSHPGGPSAGAGGNGGHGGHGGGGGGGAGGIAVGIYSTSSASVPTVIDTTYAVGAAGAGAGGPGGQSAPLAPVAERDGSNGSSGGTGLVAETRTCLAAGGC